MGPEWGDDTKTDKKIRTSQRGLGATFQLPGMNPEFQFVRRSLLRWVRPHHAWGHPGVQAAPGRPKPSKPKPAIVVILRAEDSCDPRNAENAPEDSHKTGLAALPA